MLPVKQFYKTLNGDYIMTDQVSMIRVSIGRDFHNVSRTRDKVIIEDIVARCTTVTETEFNTKYAEAIAQVQIYEIVRPNKK